MKKGILKVLGITALVAVSSLGGLALGAEISNGFEKTYSESAYIEYGNKQKEQGKQEGFENGFEAGQIYRDPEKTYLEDVFAGYAVNIVKTENYTFLSSATLSLPGLYLLNADGSTTQIYDSGCSWSYFNKLSNGNFLISSSYTAAPGILLYDTSTNEVIQIYTSSNGWRNFQELSNGNVLISNTKANSGILLYNATTNEITRIYINGCDWVYFQELSNGNVLIASSGSDPVRSGILLYNNNTNEVTKIYSSGSKWDTFIPDENGVTISSSVNADQGSVYYDFETGTVTPIEEVA